MILIVACLLVSHVHVLCGLLLVEEHNTLYPSSSYGNAFDQANRLFSLTTKFNATDYFGDYMPCITSNPKPYHCMKYVNKYHREFARIWGPPHIDKNERYPKPQADCRYTVGRPSMRTHNGYVEYLLPIVQRDCRSQADIVGGAVFEVFGIGRAALGACHVIDHFNNKYTASCSFTTIDNKENVPNNHQHSSSPDPCVRLSIVLMYEHFDGFSEVLLDWSHRYPPTRSVVADGIKICPTDAYRSSTANQEPVDGVRLPESVKWMTGSWMRAKHPVDAEPFYSLARTNPGQLRSSSSAQSNYFYHFGATSATSTYMYNMFWNVTVNYTTYADQFGKTLLLSSVQPPRDQADHYVFVPYVYTHSGQLPPSTPGLNEVSHHTCAARGFDMALCVKYAHLSENQHKHSDNMQTVGPLLSVLPRGKGQLQREHFLRNITSDLYHPYLTNVTVVNYTTVTGIELARINPSPQHLRYDNAVNMMYHFVGASHMRYNFDAVCEYFYGPALLQAVPRKHDALQITNMKYNFIANARHQWLFLTDLCNKLQNDTLNSNRNVSNSNHTLIFQTGAWDLSSASLRRAMQAPEVGPRLLQLFQEILSGELPCGRLTHIVWLTTLPHHMCNDDKNTQCNGHRSYRTNSAIAALNTFYLRGLFEGVRSAASKRMGSAQIRVTVVDTFGIVSPRLMFNEDNEVNCLNHYTCRVTGVPNRRYGDGLESILIQTPAGTAIVQSIINALVLDSYV